MAKREKFAATQPAGETAPGSPQVTTRPGSSHSDARPTLIFPSLFRRLFSFNTLLAFLLLGAVAGTVYLNIKSTADAPASDAGHSIIEGDTWWHLAAGNHILATHTWPTKDQYSFSARGDPWIAYEWAGEVAVAAAYRLAGLKGMTVLMVSLSACIVLLMFEYARLRSHNTKAAFVACALMLPLTAVSFTLRPQLIGYIFLLITLIWLEKFRQGRQRTLWLLPPLFLVWVNVHGTFAFGLAALGLYWVSGLADFRIGRIRSERWTGKQRRHIAIVTLLSIVALFMTPYGTQLAAYPVNMAFFQPVNIASFQEWRGPDFSGMYGSLLLASILLFLALPLFVRLEYRLEELGLLVFGIYAACVHMRFVIIFAMLFVPFLAVLVTRYVPPYSASNDKPFLNLALVALIAFGCVKLFPSRLTLEKMVSREFPVEAVQYIRQHPGLEPVFNEEFWGGYLIRQLGPQQKVFIDGRADLYESAGVLSDYIRIMSVAPDTTFLLQKYHVRSCLIKTDSSLATLLAHLPGWRRVYSDPISVIYVRRTKAVAREARVKSVAAASHRHNGDTFGRTAAG